MTDITEDLRLYRELEPIWEKFLDRSALEGLVDRDWSEYPTKDDPRVTQFIKLEAKLEQIAIHSTAVTISDPTMHRVFHAMRLKTFDESLDDQGCIVSDETFDDLFNRYNPHDIVAAFQKTKPLVTLNFIPLEVDRLITETREAYSLGLPTACIALCRSTVERVIVDIAVRCGRIQDEDRLGDMGMCDRISLLIDRSVSRSSPLRQQINAFMEATSNVIHSNSDADMDSALKLYHDSISLIQALYGQYKNQFKK